MLDQQCDRECVFKVRCIGQYGLNQFLGHIAVWNNPRVLGSENKVGKVPEDSLYKYSSKPDATNMRCVKMSIFDGAAAVFCCLRIAASPTS